MNHTIPADRYRGCLLGLGAGDALGAPYEGGPLERLAWMLIGRSTDGRRYTDDTQMTIDLARSYLEQGRLDQDHLAHQFARSYRWSRGYGPGAARLLKRIRKGTPWPEAARSVYPDGSFGNGAAMRAPVLAMFSPGDDAARDEAARLSAEITHAHPLGIEGAVVIAAATSGFLRDLPDEQILDDVLARSHTPMHQKLRQIGDLLSSEPPTASDLVEALGNDITALGSCPMALYVALRFRARPFEELLRLVIACGGDVDTIAAMAGAMWGAGRGEAELPATAFEGRDTLRALADRVHSFAHPTE